MQRGITRHAGAPTALSLFSGCGGLDRGFERAGFDIVWAGDIDQFAVKTYKENFPDTDIHCIDIYDVNPADLPPYDVLLAGFPCQPFSIMGSEMGFEDERGGCFGQILRLVRGAMARRATPQVLVLENVRRLRTHAGGETFRIIREALEDLGYSVFDAVLNSADYGVPQTRRRTFIVCFADAGVAFRFPEPRPLEQTLQELLEPEVADRYFLSERILPTILSGGSGGYHSSWDIDLEVARPLCATMAKMHRACQDNYVTQNDRVRRLTPRECARLQGFEDTYVIPVSDSQAYKQIGNAVTVSVAEAVALAVLEALQAREDARVCS